MLGEVVAVAVAVAVAGTELDGAWCVDVATECGDNEGERRIIEAALGDSFGLVIDVGVVAEVGGVNVVGIVGIVVVVVVVVVQEDEGEAAAVLPVAMEEVTVAVGRAGRARLRGGTAGPEELGALSPIDEPSDQDPVDELIEPIESWVADSRLVDSHVVLAVSC
jgi:hypothetical protein